MRGADGAGYPGGVRDPTDRVLQEPGINKQFSKETNDTVKISVHTRTRDQLQINGGQLAFIDNGTFDKPRLLSVQQLNEFLLKNRGLAKHEIKDRFKLLGAVVNRDVDAPAANREGIARTFTIATRGDVTILDYWSHEGARLRRYDMCYFVLKKVLITPDWRTQTTITTETTSAPPREAVGERVWQVVPYHVKDRCIRPEAYTAHGVVGTYWRVGLVHEYAAIAAAPQRRSETDVARDITFISGRSRPMQFYLWLDDGTKLT